MGKWRRRKSLPKRWNRNKILNKYGGCCGICTKPFKKMGEVTIDHVVPVSKGGADVVENMQPAHYRCNRMKRDMTPEEFDDYQASFK